MSAKLEGFDELQKSLNDVQNKVNELAGEQQVSFDILFDKQFMNNHSNFSSFDELLLAGNYEVNSQEDFEAIPESEFDIFISQNTSFNSWEEMMSAAGTEYLSKQFNNLF